MSAIKNVINTNVENEIIYQLHLVSGEYLRSKLKSLPSRANGLRSMNLKSYEIKFRKNG